MDGIYWETFYNGDKIPDDQTGYIFFENKLLGVPRIRQVKVRNDSCVVHRDFADDIKEFGFNSQSLEPSRPGVTIRWCPSVGNGGYLHICLAK